MESILALVAQKIVDVALTPAASQALQAIPPCERKLRNAATEKMIRIRSEFEHMRVFISHVDMQKYNTAIEPWLKRAREIADKMEDVIDEYLHLNGEQSQNRLLNVALNHCPIPNKSTNPWLRIDGQLIKIEADLVHLNQMKQRYVHSNEGALCPIKQKQQGGEGEDSSSTVLVSYPANGYPVKDEHVIIEKENEENLTNWLTDRTPVRRIISVKGMGGLGKTTMVDIVYKSKKVDDDFDIKGWVTISSSYRITHVLKVLLKDLLGRRAQHDEDSSMSDLNALLEKVQEILQE
ncbi:resistance candidate NBS-type protein [Canna indica]|uniref:Resistance candidate NBS-type protein n=1 Tax=Canna indica TaxID=4628 RepID=A0AAQ3KNY0_9LILI|nr:resistance candidate NBS-type protein [Canna indica]